jgi:hypothetical protein
MIPAVTIENTAPAAMSISTTNGPSGTAGRIDPGDSVTFTYTEVISPASILSGWTGASSAVQAKFAYERAGTSLTIWNSAGTTQLPLANPLALGATYVPFGTAVFSATIVQQGTSITVTLGARISGAVSSTPVTRGTITWSPSPSALNQAGVKCTSAKVSANGPAF